MKKSDVYTTVFVTIFIAAMGGIVYMETKKPQPLAELEIRQKEDTTVSRSTAPGITLEEIERRRYMSQYSMEQINSVNNNFKSLVDSKGVKVSFSNKTAQIDPLLWLGFDMDGKKSLMQVIQLKCGFQELENPSSFTYYNMKTGRVLAEYSDWSGFSFK